MDLRKRSGLQKLARVLELPADIVMDISRITMLGNQQLLIENHRGIIEYTPSTIRVNLDQGTMTVRGKAMSLGNLQLDQILIEGKVEEIKYDT